MNGYQIFKKGFHGLSDIRTKKIDRTLNYQTTVWLDDIVIVKSGIKKNTKKTNYNKREHSRSRIPSQ